MDMADIDKEIGSISIPKKPGKRLDMTVKHAQLKVVVLRILAVLFMVAVGLLGIYSVQNYQSTGMDSKVIIIISLIYLALGVYVSVKLWNLDFIGWLTLTLISLAGVALPALSAYNHGLMVGTLPIIAVCLVTLALMWYAKDVFGIKKIGDIFNPYR